MAAYDHCSREIEAIIGRPITEKETIELERLIGFKASVMREINKAMGEADALKQAGLEVAEERKRTAVLKRRNQAANLLARTGNLESIFRVYPDNPMEGLNAKLGGILEPREGSRDSTALNQWRLSTEYEDSLLGKVRAADDLWATASNLDPVVQTEIHLAHSALGREKDDPTAMRGFSAKAVAIARLGREAEDRSHADMWDAGFYIPRNEDRIGAQAHERYLVENASEIVDGVKSRNPEENVGAWVRLVKNVPGGIDRKATFAKVNEQTIKGLQPGENLEQRLREDEDKYLFSIGRTLATGIHLQSLAPIDHPDPLVRAEARGHQTIMDQLTRGQLLVFATPEGQAFYASKFQHPLYIVGIANAVARRAKYVALVKDWGPDAQSNFNYVYERVLERQRNIGKSGTLNVHEVKLMWQQVTGEASVPINVNLANFSMTARAVNLASDMGQVMLNSMGDMGSLSSELRYQGVSVVQRNAAIAEVAGMMFTGEAMTPEAQLRMAIYGVATDSARNAAGELDVPIHGGHRTLGLVSQQVHRVFRWGQMVKFQDSNRWTFIKTVNAELAGQKGIADFDQLQPETRRAFLQYGIDQTQWNIIRNHLIDKDPRTGFDFVLIERLYEADTIPDQVLIDALIERGDTPNKTNISKYKFELRNKFNNYMRDRTDFATPKGDARTRIYTSWGNQRDGSIAGEAINLVMQYKEYSILMFQRGIGREVYGYSPIIDKMHPFSEARKGTRGQAMWGLMNHVSYVWFLGLMSAQLQALAQGQYLKMPTDARDIIKLAMLAFVKGGGAGIVGDLIFGQAEDRYGRSALSTIMGPTWANLEDLYSRFAKTKDFLLDKNTTFGDIIDGARAGKVGAGIALNLIIQHAPFINLFYLRPAMNYALLWAAQEWINPGYIKRHEERVRTELGREYFFRPTEFAFGR